MEDTEAKMCPQLVGTSGASDPPAGCASAVTRLSFEVAPVSVGGRCMTLYGGTNVETWCISSCRFSRRCSSHPGHRHGSRRSRFVGSQWHCHCREQSDRRVPERRKPAPCSLGYDQRHVDND